MNLTFALAGLAIASGLEDRLALFRAVAVSFSLIVMLVYLTLVLGAIRFLREGVLRPWAWLVLLSAGAFPVLGIYGTLSPFPEGPPRVGIWLTVGILATTIVWETYLRLRRREAFDRAAASALGPEDPGVVTGSAGTAGMPNWLRLRESLGGARHLRLCEPSRSSFSAVSPYR